MDKVALNDLTFVLMVDDVDKTVKYYTEVLGFKIIANVPKNNVMQWAIIKHGSIALMFQLTGSVLEEYPELSQSKMGGALTLYIKVDNINDIYNTLKDKANIIRHIHKKFYGVNEFAIKDCNGFILCFAEKVSEN